MEEAIKWLQNTISQFSMEIILFISGMFGAMISERNKNIKMNWKEKVLKMTSGGLSAAFVTPLVNDLLSWALNIRLSKEAYCGLGFYIGYLGLQLITAVIIRMHKEKKNQ